MAAIERLRQPFVRPRVGLSLHAPFVLRLALVAALGAAAFVGYIQSYPRDTGDYPAFWSPKENTGYFLATRIRDGFSYQLPHAEVLEPELHEALTLRDAAIQDGRLVPKEFAGTMLLLAAARGTSDTLALYLVPLAFISAAVALFASTRRLFGFQAALIAYTLMLTAGVFWMEALNIVSDSIFSLHFFLWGVYFFLRASPDHGVRDTAVFSAMMGASIACRYTAVLVVVPFAVALLATRPGVKPLVAAGFAGVALTGPILAYNTLVYGDPLLTGHTVELGLIERTVNPAAYSITDFGLSQSLSFARVYLANPALMLPFYLSLPALIYYMRNRNSPDARRLAIIAIVVFLIVLAFNANRVAVGSNRFLLHASVLRLMLPGFALLLPFTGVFLAKLCDACARSVPGLMRRPERRMALNAIFVALTMVLFVVQQVTFAYDAPGGIRQRMDGIRNLALERDQIVAATEPDALILTRRMDKVLFPHRQTVTVYYLASNPQPVSLERSVIANYSPPPKRVAEALITFHDSGMPTYVADEGILSPIPQFADQSDDRIESIESFLWGAGYFLEQVTEVTAVPLFRLTPLPDRPNIHGDLSRITSGAGSDLSFDPAAVVDGAADLAVTSLKAPGRARANESVEVRWVVTNEGTIAAASFVDAIVLSDRPDVASHAIVLESHPTSESLAPGASSHRHLVEVTIPHGLTPGIYYLGVVSDWTHSVPESSLTNNVASQVLVIY